MSTAPDTLRSPQQVADRRAGSPHTSMFWRMLLRAAALRRGRAASALLAMVVAAAVATAMMNLYVDVQAKLRTEFRNYGANVVVVAKNGQSLPPNAVSTIESTLGPKTLAVPFAYAVARTSDGQSVVVVGTDFARARQLDHWWNVNHWPAPQMDARLVGGDSIPTLPLSEALVGIRAAAVVTPARQPFDLTFQGRTIHLAPAGLLQTGAGEDSRIYLDQSEFQNWTGVLPTTIEVAANGSSEEIQQAMKSLAAALPAADVRPVRQIMEGEANVLNKTRATLYASATLVVLTSALCVLATLIGWVLDRRRDFAIMKALGATERLVNGFFAAEAAALGVVGAILGFFVGIGVAAWIGRANFHAPVVPRFSVFPYVLAGSVAVALISAIVPIGLLRRVQPAIILRGE
jgi:putative ABC transport system permease protein